MIQRYVYGSMIETDTIPVKPEAGKEPIPGFTVDEKEHSFTYLLGKEDRIYGLGENVRGINKRGWIYQSWASDNPDHLEDAVSLYAAHNFLVVDGEERFGLFLDYGGKVTYDIGYTEMNRLTIRVNDFNLDVYRISGDSVLSIVHQFREMIGRSYIPPRWAFGFGQSRWGYVCEADVREVVRKHRELGLPLDSVYLDIDYMDSYKDFTVNPERFPDLAGLASEMAGQGVHLVPIIDAAIKKEEGYPVSDEGIRKGYFCTDKDGKPFEGAVWPGISLFPDVLNPEARKWFGSLYKVLLDMGIEGFWNDMNEPSIFYTEASLEAIRTRLMDTVGATPDVNTFFELTGIIREVFQKDEIYDSIYHHVNGKAIRHTDVHNLYGYNMTRAAAEAFETLAKDRRILLFSRSSCIGMHRFGGTWMGDNKSWWSHLALNFRMLPSLNMCGFLYTGADLGGFGSNVTEDLLMRWLELGIFTPLMRNHSALGTREQEAYRFSDLDGFRHVLRMRYVLLPYLYSEYMKAALDNKMLFRPLAFDYPEDHRAQETEDQLMLGDSLMIAPVMQQNARGRMVYLPESMKLFRFSKDGRVLETVLGPGDHYVECELSDVIFFLRPDHLIPVSFGGSCVAEVDFDHVHFLAYPAGNEACYEYYTDDGISRQAAGMRILYRMGEDGDVKALPQ